MAPPRRRTRARPARPAHRVPVRRGLGLGWVLHPASSSRRPTRRPGAQGVPSNTTISVTFSRPVSLQKATPALSPAIAGKWVQSSATTLSYDLDSPLIPSSQEVLTIPGGSSGVRGTDGSTLATSHSVTFDVAAGDTLRLQQLLAGLDYLPVGFSADRAAAAPGPTWPRTRPAPSRGAGRGCPPSSPRSGPRARRT